MWQWQMQSRQFCSNRQLNNGLIPMPQTQKLARLIVADYGKRMLKSMLMLVLGVALLVALLVLWRGVETAFYRVFAATLIIMVVIGLIYTLLSMLILWIWGAFDSELRDGMTARHVLQARTALSTLIIVPVIVMGSGVLIADKTPYADIIDGGVLMTAFFSIVATVLAVRAVTQTAYWLEEQGLATVPRKSAKKKK